MPEWKNWFHGSVDPERSALVLYTALSGESAPAPLEQRPEDAGTFEAWLGPVGTGVRVTERTEWRETRGDP